MNKIKTYVLSDIHGYLPEIPNDCELLLIAGDLTHEGRDTGRGVKWVNTKLAPYLEELHRRKVHVVAIAGNHDYCFEQGWASIRSDLKWTLLDNSSCEYKGLKIWGSPWTPFFYDWAYNTDEKKLAQYYNSIPEDTDIIITHGPPRGILDLSPYGLVNCGSTSLLQAVSSHKNFKLHLFGHIHYSSGIQQIDGKTYINASYVGENYKPKVHPIRSVDFIRQYEESQYTLQINS